MVIIQPEEDTLGVPSIGGMRIECTTRPEPVEVSPVALSFSDELYRDLHGDLYEFNGTT